MIVKRYSLILCASVFLVAFPACEKPVPESSQPEPNVKLEIGLISPAADAVVNLSEVETVEFEWTALENVNSYKILLSRFEDMSAAREIAAVTDPIKVKSVTLDSHLAALGVGYEESVTLWWSVMVWGDAVAEVQPRKITLKRLSDSTPTYEERIADPITVKVAIVVEDFEVPGSGGKLMHEVCALHAPGGFYQNGGGWNNPYVQMEEFERDLEASSHGVLQYEVVEVKNADRIFTYFKDDVAVGEEKEYLTVDTLLYLFEKRLVDNLTSYDYVAMMKHYGYDKMVDAGELDEIWVYTFPAAGMYESQMIGNGAFWCNSPGLSVTNGAPCNELCIVMCCNYERTTDLALHAYAHRVESIMCEVYGGWNYSLRSSVKDLTNWEKFSAHNNEYEKFESKHAHIGMCHWPPNSEYDYDYGNSRFIYSYADTWYNYPDIKEENPRLINKNEWKHSGGDQWGYMMWYYDHIPHFKGLCPRDQHLNNWWHYIVKYKEAKRLERQLQSE